MRNSYRPGGEVEFFRVGEGRKLVRWMPEEKLDDGKINGWADSGWDHGEGDGVERNFWI